MNKFKNNIHHSILVTLLATHLLGCAGNRHGYKADLVSSPTKKIKGVVIARTKDNAELKQSVTEDEVVVSASNKILFTDANGDYQQPVKDTDEIKNDYRINTVAFFTAPDSFILSQDEDFNLDSLTITDKSITNENIQIVGAVKIDNGQDFKFKLTNEIVGSIDLTKKVLIDQPAQDEGKPSSTYKMTYSPFSQPLKARLNSDHTQLIFYVTVSTAESKLFKYEMKTDQGRPLVYPFKLLCSTYNISINADHYALTKWSTIVSCDVEKNLCDPFSNHNFTLVQAMSITELLRIYQNTKCEMNYRPADFIRTETIGTTIHLDPILNSINIIPKRASDHANTNLLTQNIALSNDLFSFQK